MAKKQPKTAQNPTVPKTIVATSRVLQTISPLLLTSMIARLFTTPIRHKLPKREIEMDATSRQEMIPVPSIRKSIMTYQLGESDKKILLVHGWSGRGTQLVKFADEFVKLGYQVVSFDAPAHGKSTGKTSIMPEFIASIFEVEKKFGPFDAAVGHSLGGMSILNAIKRGLKVRRAVAIGSGDVIQDIMNEFVAHLKLKPEMGVRLRKYFEKRRHETMDDFSSYKAAKEIDIPVLIIHDENDLEVNVSCAHHIHKHLKNGELMLTKGLGHRKILGDKSVISKTIEFTTL